MAPVQRRVQGPVARHRRAPSLPQKLEPTIEQRGCSLQAVDADAPGRQLQGECDAVDFAADVADDLGIEIVQRPAQAARERPSMNREAAA